jgi:hypothetical protein
MDIVVHADGYLPVHTRAYTFTDSKVVVKLTKVTDKKTLFGYREELPDAGGPPAGDGGARPPGPVPARDAGAPDR